ncbi:hypothetical protein GOV13_02305 [Candidatus Pacearchaeota archaeon]|nr:hypothetical protein [Candidatus Pacearchaeota archaeon]
MSIKKLLYKKISMTVLQRQAFVIATVLATLLLVNTWPRFLYETMRTNKYVYIVLLIISLFLIPIGRAKE